MASAPFDWSPVEKTLVGSCERERNSQLPSFALIRPNTELRSRGQTVYLMMHCNEKNCNSWY